MPNLPLPEASTNIQKYFMPSTAKLPKEEQAWIMLDVGQNTLADLEAIEGTDKNMAVMGYRVLTSRIKDWNFTDPKTGEKASITLENVIRLADEDKAYLRKLDFAAPEQQPLSEEKKSS